jgi:hypothetical protein
MKSSPESSNAHLARLDCKRLFVPQRRRRIHLLRPPRGTWHATSDPIWLASGTALVLNQPFANECSPSSCAPNKFVSACRTVAPAENCAKSAKLADLRAKSRKKLTFRKTSISSVTLGHEIISVDLAMTSRFRRSPWVERQKFRMPAKKPKISAGNSLQVKLELQK